ncbi:hypothetical protein CTI12_AA120390 [Artemisia annua]|uniref:SWIM-type domain-containing protein n=1 Tax=Artemisia annua TaxID=35608 RepID=A0A2U1PMN9_ARTAN|nr:hypothetical protein CTI12_AA120390 [Artemisia annua]
MVLLTVTFYHDGLFIGPPLEYAAGKKDIMKDLDFGGMTYALGNGGKIEVYVEHHGYDIHSWFPKDDVDLEESDEDECQLVDISAYVEEQYVGEEEVDIPNKCTNDPFLNRLCKTDAHKTPRNTFGTNEGDTKALEQDEIEDQNVDPIYKVKKGVEYPDFDPNQPWKEMKPILGMRFKDHEEMKLMLANYGVANGYQLWYKRNDYKSLLVLCSRNVEQGRCVSKNEASFQIKTLIPYHNCARVFDICSLVTYKWIASHYVREIDKLEEQNKELYMSMKVDLIEHYAQLWDYQARLLHTNPGSTVKLDVEEGAGGRTYFKRFYVCFKGLSRIEKAIIEKVRDSVARERVKVRDINLVRYWEVYASGYQEFEVRKLNEGYGVNLEAKKCTCRRWDLTGAPCIHAVAAYAMLLRDPAEVVSECYGKEAWVKTYSYFIKPVGGKALWDKTGITPLPLPPKKRKMPGRPKGKRVKHPSEVNDSNSQRVSRLGRTMTCNNCYQKGHNKTRCTNERVDPPTKEVRKAGKKKGGQCGFQNAASALKRMRMDPGASGSGSRQNERILLNQWKKPFQFDEDGTGSTPDKAFDIFNE